MRVLCGFWVLAAVVMLSACAGMSEQACLSTDWRSVGFEDGIAGRSAGSIGNYRQSCSRHGVSPDLAAYRSGHEDGVQSYCRAGNGFEVGRRGSRYQGVCPIDLESDFLAAYNEGRQLYELEAAVRTIENQIAAGQRRTEELTQAIVAASVTIIADETTPAQRAELLASTGAMAAEKVQIGEDIEELEIELTFRQSELLAYRQTLAFAF